MSRDIELIERLSREIKADITIQRQPSPSSKEYREFARERDLRIRNFKEERETFHLTGLYVRFDGVSGTSICAITDEVDRVVRLYLHGVHSDEIPRVLFRLENLEFLSFYKNDFQSLPSDIRFLKNLNTLFIQANSELRELPAELSYLPSLEDVSLLEVPQLSNPPREIAERGIGAIRNYFDSLSSSVRVDYLYEAKMVLVGRGFAGKTSLVRKLTLPDYHLEEHIPSTEGIAIDAWDLKMPLENSDRFRFNIWDFAGQEKYDATHQFFITERTLYLFVTEARQESNYLDFDYWLNVVDILGNKSPVVVVQNKIDLRKRQLPSDRYRAQFPNIVEFVDVSCADGYEETIAALKRSVEQAVSRLPQVGDRLPSEWVAVRKDLDPK